MYQLKIDANKQNNWIFTQVTSMGLDYDFDAPNSVTRIQANEPLSFSPKLESFHLDPDTKLTDIISQAYIYTIGLLVSNRLFQVLADFSLQPYRAYRAQVVHGNLRFQYHFLHVTEALEPRIDFEHSEFFERDEYGTVTSVRLANLSELQSKRKELVQEVSTSLLPRQIQFLPRTPAYDLLFLDLIPRLILISKKLKDVLLSGSFTGFEITLTEIDVRFG